MAIDRVTVRTIAELAALSLDDSTERSMGAEIETILQHVASLDTLDVSAVPPTAHAAAAGQSWRSDVEARSLSPDEALGNGPDVDRGYFRVPRVIESAH